MANVLKHRFTSARTDGADATQVQPSHWNDGHAFTGGNAGDLLLRDPTDATYGGKWAPPLAARPSGGTAGDVLTRDPTDATFGAKWVTPAPAPGIWTAVPFNAANFSGVAPLTWTIGTAAIKRNSFARVGNVLFWSIYVSWFSGSNVLGGSPGTSLVIASPFGLSLATQQQLMIDYCQGTAGVPIAVGLMITTNSTSAITITKTAGGNFALSDIPGFNTTLTMEIV